VIGGTLCPPGDTVKVDVQQGAVELAMRDSAGHWYQRKVLTAGEAGHVLRLESWLSQAGYDLGNAGVPFGEAMRIGRALQDAAIRAGAEAGRRGGR
ncbi:MAG TPA: hypothetical protein VNU46_00065, partial [Gemmatimonadaceae bacterium]|nr:hypothetical protein [Gemmatimonadaceae bacterium]